MILMNIVDICGRLHVNKNKRKSKTRNYEHIEHQVNYKGATIYKDKKKEIPRKDKYKKVTYDYDDKKKVDDEVS